MNNYYYDRLIYVELIYRKQFIFIHFVFCFFSSVFRDKIINQLVSVWFVWDCARREVKKSSELAWYESHKSFIKCVRDYGGIANIWTTTICWPAWYWYLLYVVETRNSIVHWTNAFNEYRSQPTVHATVTYCSNAHYYIQLYDIF